MANEFSYKKLGAKIRQLRKLQKLTIAQLAELAGIDDYYLGEIERAEKKPSLDILSKLVNALNIEMYLLFKFDDKDN